MTNVTQRNRKAPTVRHNEILTRATELARTVGYTNLSKFNVAAAAGCSPSLVRHYFTTSEELRRAVMREAIRTEVTEIILQGLVVLDPDAQAAPKHLKDLAITQLQFE